MIRRLGFRRLLPLVFTLLQALLLMAASAHQVQPTPSARSYTTQHLVSYQEGDGKMAIDPIRSRPMTLVFKLSVVLNLPAFFAGALLATALSRSSELSVLWASTPFVPLLWFGIGRWLDGVLGYRVRRLRALVNWRGFWACWQRFFY